MFRILSIDGGGLKGAFPCAFLASIEDVTGRPIQSYFDLIAGTSTGGIIAIGLGLGMSPKEILKFYTKDGSSIFPASQSWARRLRHCIRNKYESDPLRDSLSNAFHQNLLGHSTKRLIIPSFSALTGKIYIYKTPHHRKFESDWRCPAVDVGMATSAAPSFFPPYVNPTYISHLDGGMWANNPTGIAVVEAVGNLGIKREEIKVLSIGCTSVAQSFSLKNAGLFGWSTKALKATQSGQSFGSMGVASVLIGAESIQRVNPTVEAGRFSLDNHHLVTELVGRAAEAAREALPRFRKLFGEESAPAFTPLYGPLSAHQSTLA